MTKIRVVLKEDGWVQLRMRSPMVNGGKLIRQEFQVSDDNGGNHDAAVDAVTGLREGATKTAQVSTGKQGSVQQ